MGLTLSIAGLYAQFPRKPKQQFTPTATFQTCGGVEVVKSTNTPGVLTIPDAVAQWHAEGCTRFVFEATELEAVNDGPIYLGYGVRIE